MQKLSYFNAFDYLLFVTQNLKFNKKEKEKL